MKRYRFGGSLVCLGVCPLQVSSDIAMTGEATMALAGGYVESGDRAQFLIDLTLGFEGLGETQSGTSFGFILDLERTEDGTSVNGPLGFDGAEVFIESDFGRLALGDIDGAYAYQVGEVGLGSSPADDETAHAGYFAGDIFDGSSDGPVLRYDYAFGDFELSVSMEQDGIDGDIYGLGFYYWGEVGAVSYEVGLGYQRDDADALAGASLGFAFGNGVEFCTSLAAFDSASGEGFRHAGLGLSYGEGPLTVSANFGRYEFDGGGAEDGFGVTIGYDLGGGATLSAGYGRGGGESSWSAGLTVSF